MNVISINRACGSRYVHLEIMIRCLVKYSIEGILQIVLHRMKMSLGNLFDSNVFDQKHRIHK